MNPLRLYFRLLGLAIHSRMQYRADFITGLVGVIIWNVVSLGTISILVMRFTSLNGWSLWQMVFLYCLWMLAHSLYSLVFHHLRTLEDYLLQGTFDQFLLRPASPFVLFIGRDFNYAGIADLGFGITGVVLAYTKLGLHWNGLEWSFFFLAILSGTLIEMTLNLMIACLSFWTGRSRRANSLLSQVITMIQNYPVDIYGTTFRVIVTGLIPVAFMNYYPALWLLGKLDFQSPWYWLSYLSPVVALLMMGLAATVWNFALQHYSSSGG